MNNISFLSASNNIAGLKQSADIIDESQEAAGIVYFGYCKPGTYGEAAPTWTICKMTTIAGIVAFKWANGSAAFDKVWNNRAEYEYKFSNFRVV